MPVPRKATQPGAKAVTDIPSQQVASSAINGPARPRPGSLWMQSRCILVFRSPCSFLQDAVARPPGSNSVRKWPDRLSSGRQGADGAVEFSRSDKRVGSRDGQCVEGLADGRWIVCEGQIEVGGGLQPVVQSPHRIEADFILIRTEPAQGDRGVGHGAVEILFCQRPDVFPDLRTYAATDQIIDWRMDTAPNARDPGLVGGVVIGGPLQGDRLGGPVFKAEDIVRIGAQAAWEERRTGHRSEDFRGGTAERAVA